MPDNRLRELNRKYAQAKRAALRELAARHQEEYWALYRAKRIEQERSVHEQD
ncbi:MAG TPA: hypothetical protein VHE33_10040 [Acidobacteriaceae bacterium]|nr:hypothetical protein [Acidobacteriaceae bacterium]